jgi:hypothetical protein
MTSKPESSAEMQPSVGLIRRCLGAARDVLRMPRVEVNLMAAAAADNDPFYARLVSEFYTTAMARHPRFPLLRRFAVGVALCELAGRATAYMDRIEASGRRNVKKAQRLGYSFGRLDYNAHLDDVRAIRASTPVRQGRVPEEFVNGDVSRCSDPPSRSTVHDYVYFGVFRDGRLFAYDGCFVCGEVCMIEQLLGHADYLADGVVPLLLVETAKAVCSEYPNVRFYMYGTFFGAGPSMKRFKRKFGFHPCRVTWKLQ